MSTTISPKGKQLLGWGVIALAFSSILFYAINPLLGNIATSQFTRIISPLINDTIVVAIYIFLLATARTTKIKGLCKIGIIILIINILLACIHNLFWNYLIEEHLYEDLSILSIINSIRIFILLIPGVIMFYWGTNLPLIVKLTAIFFCLCRIIFNFLSFLLYSSIDDWEIASSIQTWTYVIMDIVELIIISIPTLIWMYRKN